MTKQQLTQFRTAHWKNEVLRYDTTKMPSDDASLCVILTMIRDGEYEYYETAMFVLEENESDEEILKKTVSPDIFKGEDGFYTVQGDYRIFEVYSVQKIENENDYMTLRRYI